MERNIVNVLSIEQIIKTIIKTVKIMLFFFCNTIFISYIDDIAIFSIFDITEKYTKI